MCTLLGSHGVDNSFDSLKGIIIYIDVLDCFSHTGDHGNEISNIPHLLDLMDLFEEVVKVELVFGNALL